MYQEIMFLHEQLMDIYQYLILELLEKKSIRN